MPQFISLAPTDIKLIRPHVEAWQSVIDTIASDRLITDEIIDEIIPGRYVGEYRRQFRGALIRYSIARGDLSRFGDAFVKIGRSRETSLGLTELLVRGGWEFMEHAPGQFIGYSERMSSDGTQGVQEISVFARRVGDTFRWMIVSIPIEVQIIHDEIQLTDQAMSQLSRRFDILAMM